MTDLGPPVVPRPFGTLSNFPTPSSSGGWPSQPLAVVLAALLFAACSAAALGGESGSPAPAGEAAPAEAGPVPAADRPILIGRITIEIVDVFDPSKRGEDGWFNRFVDLLHIRTREEVIRRQLLFHEGDVLDPEVLAETERNLRALGYLRKAEVTADQHENGAADVHVRVQDSWTTRASYGLGRTGGHTRAELEAQEVNLLGFGKKLGFSFATSSSVVPGRGCSSWSRATEPSSLRTAIIERSNRPSAMALAARSWLVTARLSQSALLKPSSVAMRSAEMPCGTIGYFSRSAGLSPSIVGGASPSTGQRDIDSTPPPITRSCMPDRTPMAASVTAC